MKQYMFTHKHPAWHVSFVPVDSFSEWELELMLKMILTDRYKGYDHSWPVLELRSAGLNVVHYAVSFKDSDPSLKSALRQFKDLGTGEPDEFLMYCRSFWCT